MKLIIDTDGGIDDAVALLMALAHPNVTVQAVTTVMGNVSLAQATHNIGFILDTAASPLSLYQGCAKPLLQYPPINAKEIHGTDGLGGAAAAKTTRRPQSQHAALALIEQVRRAPGEITLLTLGPLTNIALALRLAPDLLQKLDRLVVMGGSVDGRGNTTAAAEFNIIVDPEAAAIVFGACRRADVALTLISWETTLAYLVPLSTWKQMVEGASPTARLLQRITAFIEQQWWGQENIFWPDPLAVAVALEPEIVQADEIRFASVDTGHTASRGQTIVDYRPHHKTHGNIRIIRQVDTHRFYQLLHSAVLA